MRVQMWLDFACPFCYIGSRYLQLALEKLPASGDVEVIYRSFELDPQAFETKQTDIYTQLANKYNMSLVEAKNMTAGVARRAKEIGLNFNFDTLIPTNTFDAHRLLHFAGSQGLMREMAEHLFKAFFTDSLNVADDNTLIKLATEVGLDKRATESMLISKEYDDIVRGDEKLARQLKISSVPFFIFNNNYRISGAQSVDSLSEMLLKVYAEEQNIVTSINPGDSSSSNSCPI